MPTANGLRYNDYYYERDPKRKTITWAKEIVQVLRAEWQPIVPVRKTRENREILHAKQNLDDVKRAFRMGETFSDNHKWVSIAVMQRLIQVLTAEFKKSAYSPSIESIDVAAEKQRRRDKKLLQLRSLLEQPLSDIARRVGGKPEKIDKDQFEGDVEQFDQMGLDSNSEVDVNFFMERFHRLRHEVSSQKLVHSLMRYNKFENRIEDLVCDILAAGCVTYEVYADQSTGEIKWRHLEPEVVKAIWGEEPDGSDAAAIGWEKNVTIRQFLQLANKEFDIKRDGELLKNAINFYNSTNYTRVTSDGCWANDAEGNPMLVTTYASMLGYTVGVGKMQWKSIDGTSTLRHKKSGLIYDIDYSDDTSRKVEYIREDSFYERTYKSLYLGTGSNDVFLFRFGPLYHQLSHGIGDEFSSFSIHVFRCKGQTAVEIAEPFIRMANLAFHKIYWGLEESLPSIDNVNYEAFARLIQKSKPDMPSDVNGGSFDIGIVGQLDAIVKKWKHSLTRVYSSTDEDGQVLGGDGRPHYREEGKVDPLAVGMITVLDWAEGQVALRLGINPLRLAETPDPKDGKWSGQERLKSSLNATYYVPAMIISVVKDTAGSSLNIAQDAIEIKTTPTYGWLENLIGEEAIITFKDLEKIPMHRYGVFVEMFNTEQKRQEMKAEALMAFQQQQITYDQYLLVKEIDDFKQAGLQLAFYRHKTEQAKQKELAMQHQRAMQLEQHRADLELRNIQVKGNLEMQKVDLQGQWTFKSFNADNNAALAKKQIDVDSNNQKVHEQADAKIKVLEAGERAKNQTPLPPSTVEPEGQPPVS